MVKFTSHFSSSEGNLYTLQLGDTKILIECGISFKKLLKTISLAEYSACFVTHEHLDHSRSINKVAKYIDTYASKGTINYLKNNLKIDENDVKIASNQKIIYINDDITIMPFKTFHNCAEPVGFLIKYKDNKILFAIDTYDIPYSFRNLTHIYIEANYSFEYLDGFNRNSNHMEIKSTLQFINEHKTEYLRDVKLLHISKEFGSEVIFNKMLKDELWKE